MTRFPVLVAAFFCLGASARASFEKGGLLESGPRSAALGGATAADVRDAISAPGSPAGLAFVSKEYVQAAGGGTTQASLSNYFFGGGTAVNGIGVSGLFRRKAFSGGSENALGLNAGLPVAELPWVALGAGLKFLQTDLGRDRATGFGFDAGVSIRPPLPWHFWNLSLAAGIEDALGDLNWNGGLKEDLESLRRLAAAVHWAGNLGVLAEVDFAGSSLGRETILAAGCEYSARIYGRSVEFRLGVRDGTRRETSVSGGVGVVLDRYSFDYALVGMEESQGYLHLFSAQMTFGSRYFPFGPGLFGSGDGGAKPETGVVRLVSPYQTMRFNIECPPARRHIASWALLVADFDGQVVWETEGEGRPAESVVWNCVTDEGEVAADGAYCVQLVLRGGNSFRYLSKSAWFRIERLLEPDPAFPESTSFAAVSASVGNPAPVAQEAKPEAAPPVKKAPLKAKVAPPTKSPPAGPSLLGGLTAAPNPLDLSQGDKLAIKFNLGRRSDFTVIIYDQDMKVSYRFVERRAQSGPRTVEWNGRGVRGEIARPGSYRVTVIVTDGVDLASETLEVVLAAIERHG